MKTMPWGEDITVTMQLGFLADGFKLDDPTLGVLGTGVLDGKIEGADVTEYVTGISIGRGRSDQFTQFNAGTCTITLDNSDRRFDPINESSPYWDSTLGRTGVVPRRRVTVKSGSELLFSGKITDIDISYSPVEPTSNSEISIVEVSCADDFVLLASTFTDSAIIPSEELSGSRVSAILDLPEVSYPLASRDIDAGVAVLGGGAPFSIPTNTNVLTYLNNVAASERGYFYISREGNLRFTKRQIQLLATPSALFSDSGDIFYSSVDIVYGQELLYNKVIASIVGGTEQIVDDTASQTEYGVSTLSTTELLLKDDSSALTLANLLLDAYSEPNYRYDNLTTSYNVVGTSYYSTLSQLDIGDVISVTRTYVTGTPTTVTKSYSIEQLRHEITTYGHQVLFKLSSVTILQPFILAGYTTVTRTNLVPNPNFEINTTTWAFAGSSGARSTAESYVGTACLYVTSTGTDTTARTAYDPNTTAVGGQVFTASAYVRNVSGNTRNHRLDIRCFTSGGGGNGSITGKVVSLSVGGEWTRLSVTGTIPANTASIDACLFFQANNASVSNVTAVDAVMLEAGSSLLPYFDGTFALNGDGYTMITEQWNGSPNQSTSTAEFVREFTRTNLSPNPSVETDLNGWALAGTATGSVTQSNTFSYAGGFSAQLTVTGSGTGGIATPTVTGFTPGQTVTASVYVRGNVAKSCRLQMNTYTSGGVFVNQFNGTGQPCSTSDWVRLSATCTIPATVDRVRCFIEILSVGSGDVFYADAMIVENTTELSHTYEALAPNLIDNGSFETNTDKWFGSGTANSTIARTTAQSIIGTASASLTAANAGNARAYFSGVTNSAVGTTASRLPVTAGKTYSLSAFVRAATVGRSCDLILEFYNAAGTLISHVPETPEITNSTTQWTKLPTLTATAPIGATSVVPSLRIFSVGIGEVHYLDEVVLQETPLVLPYFDGNTSDLFSGYTLISQGWSGTANNSASTAKFGVDSAEANGSILDDIYALGEKAPYSPFIFDQSEFDNGFSFQ